MPEVLLKLKWKKYVERRADLQKSLQFGQGTGFQFHKFFGTKNITHHLYYFNGRTTSVYFDENDFAKFTESFVLKLRDLDFIKTYKNHALEMCDQTLCEGKDIINAIKNNQDNLSLINLFVEFNGVWKSFYPIGWAAFYLINLETIVEEKLTEIIGNASKAKDVLKLIVHPTTLTPIMSSEIDILHLAHKIKTENKNSRQFALEMAKKYGWMSVYNFNDNPRGQEYYLEEAQKIINSGVNVLNKIQKLENDRQHNEKKFQEIIKTIDDKLLEKQIRLLHIIGYLRDKREEVRDRLTILARKLYEKIADVTDFLLEDVVYLSNEEIIELLSHSDENTMGRLAKIAQKRQKHFLFLINDDKVKIIDEQAELDKYLQEIPREKGTGIISGQVAYKQKSLVIGRVKIVFSNKELNKVNEGDVLVATMTKPDFVGAIKKAVALVTNEGGITCHAAIVARELKKPCIIGTKIATQILKDGDLVEIDSENGTIKILK